MPDFEKTVETVDKALFFPKKIKLSTCIFQLFVLS